MAVTRDVNHSPEWIIVLCPPKSCSTVVTAMLGCHPDVYAFPELQLLCFQTVGELLAEDEWIMDSTGIPLGCSAGVIRGVINLAGFRQDESGVAQALSWLKDRAHWENYKLLNWFQERVYPRTAVAKSTSVGQDPAALRRLSGAMSGTRFIHLIRNPVATIQSQLMTIARTEPHASQYSVYLSRVLLHHHCFIETFLSTLQPVTSFRVRAEDLLLHPQALAQLARQLGLQADDVAISSMRHPENWLFARPGPTPLEAEGDLAFYSDPRLRSVDLDPLCIPPEWQLDPALRKELAELASANGYALADS